MTSRVTSTEGQLLTFYLLHIVVLGKFLSIYCELFTWLWIPTVERRSSNVSCMILHLYNCYVIHKRTRIQEWCENLWTILRIYIFFIFIKKLAITNYKQWEECRPERTQCHTVSISYAHSQGILHGFSN